MLIGFLGFPSLQRNITRDSARFGEKKNSGGVRKEGWEVERGLDTSTSGLAAV
jgi:hypothetical protein